MRRENHTKVSLIIALAAIAGCGTPDAGISATSAVTSAALGKDPAGSVSVIAAAAAELPPPAADPDNETPPPTCAQAFLQYNNNFSELNAMVEWHALYPLQPYQIATGAGAEASEQNCSLSLRTAKSCEELLATFNSALGYLRATPEYTRLAGTEEWRTTLVAYQTLKLQNCFE